MSQRNLNPDSNTPLPLKTAIIARRDGGDLQRKPARANESTAKSVTFWGSFVLPDSVDITEPDLDAITRSSGGRVRGDAGELIGWMRLGAVEMVFVPDWIERRSLRGVPEVRYNARETLEHRRIKAAVYRWLIQAGVPESEVHVEHELERGRCDVYTEALGEERLVFECGDVDPNRIIAHLVCGYVVVVVPFVESLDRHYPAFVFTGNKAFETAWLEDEQERKREATKAFEKAYAERRSRC